MGNDDLTLCMLGNFFMFLLSSAGFLNKTIHSGTLLACRTVWTKIAAIKGRINIDFYNIYLPDDIDLRD